MRMTPKPIKLWACSDGSAVAVTSKEPSWASTPEWWKIDTNWFMTSDLLWLRPKMFQRLFGLPAPQGTDLLEFVHCVGRKPRVICEWEPAP